MRYLAPIFAAVLAFSTACTTTDSTSPTVSLTGTWTLRSLNGFPLPYTVSSGSAITSEVLTLNSDGTYTDVATYSNGTHFTEVGYYSTNNNVITFNDQTDNLQYTGSISGSVLTEISSNGQFTSVYQKQ